MTTVSCQSPLAWDELLAYWLGELDNDNAAHIEEHYLGCAQCSRRLEQLAALAQGIGELARSSGVNMVIDDSFVAQLRKDGLQVREYRVPPNGSVNCTITPEDNFVVGRLEVPLAGVQRIDLLSRFSFDEKETRLEDVPFVADSDGVLFAPPVEAIRAMPASSLRLRLLAVDETGERMLAEYTFNHTPHRA
ncbi:MAG: hypothetical protein P8Z75_07275 [Gammaproteobacteria bacterium]|jgi:hypothetical protein